MQITVFGTGYVGLVTGACLAEVGNDVVCVDIAADRVAQLSRGEVPFFEPGLPELVATNHAAGRLRFSTDEKRAVAHGRVLFIAVGTPPPRTEALTYRRCSRSRAASGKTFRAMP